eukprot:m.284036 g.284036  ORF g.284036 m.284036 type:complete len:59 (+) comp15761_c0_seq7:389-565(+)
MTSSSGVFPPAHASQTCTNDHSKQATLSVCHTCTVPVQTVVIFHACYAVWNRVLNRAV